jgi:lipopolysaccharide heptosyltransferase II
VDLEAEARTRGRKLRVLVTRLRYLGDVILTIPAVAAFKERYPEAEVYYCAERPYAGILEGNPHLAGIIGLERSVRGTLETLLELRRMRFIAAIDLFYNPRSAWLLFFAGIPIRVGGSRRTRRRLYTHAFSARPGTRSAVLHHSEALALFGVEAKASLPRVYLTTDEREAGRRLLMQTVGARRAGDPVIAFHAGGTWPAKRWSPQSFATLARLLHKKWNAKICALTGPGEEGLARSVRDSAPEAVAVLPLQTLRTVASAIASCSAVVANDGGIMHLSVALGRPTVGIFGPTEPDVWFPYEGRGPFALVTHMRPCAPCHKHQCESLECLTAVAPEEVLARVEEVIAWEG